MWVAVYHDETGKQPTQKRDPVGLPPGKNWSVFTDAFAAVSAKTDRARVSRPTGAASAPCSTPLRSACNIR